MMNEGLILYVGGLIALGSLSGFFVLVDYFQHKQDEKEKETRVDALAQDLVLSEKKIGEK